MRNVHRLLASLIVMLAALGLLISPASACASKAIRQPVATMAMASNCHATKEAPAEQKAPDAGKECCKAMCSGAILLSTSLDLSSAPNELMTAARDPSLTTVAHIMDKPPPRSAA
jgi:hypothetical protein